MLRVRKVSTRNIHPAIGSLDTARGRSALGPNPLGLGTPGYCYSPVKVGKWGKWGTFLHSDYERINFSL